MKILVCAETRHGAVQPISFELLTGARRFLGDTAGTVEALVTASDAATAAKPLGAADAIIAVSHPAFDQQTAEAYGIALSTVVAQRQPDLVLCGYTALGLDVAPNLAAQTRRPLVAYVTVFTQGDGLAGDGLVTAESQVYGGKFVARTETILPAILVINPGAFPETAAQEADVAQIIAVEPPAALDHLKVRFVEEMVPDKDAVDLTQAERIVCVGRGIGDKDSIDLARDLAEALDAEIAGSRPVVDGGWLPKERQVGKSGRKVKPKLYISFGVSGAPEHLEGMTGADLIIAVNTDATAPIFDVAHVGATCDLFDLLPALTDRVKSGSAR
ncbi:MAG: electron transfer flavoprotein subunit alpha/FixB family protein [Dongiaceae bacterium]